MPGGRPPKPRAVKKAKGTLRSDREPANPVDPTPGEPPMPDYLGGDARECWEFYAPRLVALRIMAEADWGQFVRMCQSWGRIRDCERIIAEEGYTFETAKGYKQQIPEVGILHAAEERFHKLAGRFGVDPSSRSGIDALAASPKGNAFIGLVG